MLEKIVVKYIAFMFLFGIVLYIYLAIRVFLDYLFGSV